MYAAENGNTDIVKILLEHGADTNFKNNNGKFHNISILFSLIFYTP